jgi:solute carrier family 25 iron transporter 28/37
MEHVSMYPVDTVKTHLQASPEKMRVGEAVQAVVRSRGIVGLMRGSTVIGAGCVPAHIGFFGVYELSMAKFVGWENEEHHPLRVAGCGSMATLWHDCILTPHDVVKQRLQLGCHSGPLDCITGIWRQEGLRGFFRSLPVTLAMNIPHMGLLVAANDSLKKTCKLDQKGATPLAKAPWYFACAGLSGAFAGAATLPFDVIKTKIQTQGGAALPAASTAVADSQALSYSGVASTVASLRTSGFAVQQCRFHSGRALQYSGVASTVASIARENGLRGFYTGLVPRVVICAPSAAVCWGTYETARLVLQRFGGDLRSPQSEPIFLQG